MDYTNYARALELRKFIIVNEAGDPDPVNALNLVLSGKTDAKYKPQWEQLKNHILANADKGDTGTITIHHDANINGGAEMVTVNWAIDKTTGKVTYSVATNKSAPTAPSDLTNNASNAIKNQRFLELAGKICTALYGFTENEDAVIAVFRDDIKTDADFQSFLKYFSTLPLPLIGGNMGAMSWPSIVSGYKSGKPTGRNYYKLEGNDGLIHKYFSPGEIGQLNSVLTYTKFRF